MVSLGAARKRTLRGGSDAWPEGRTEGSRQYKDKWPRGSTVPPRPGPAKVRAKPQESSPGHRLPKHVSHCFGRGGRGWWVYTWKKATPDVKRRAPYNCSSWRCTACRRHEASVTFARIKQACEPFESSGWVYLVLTIDRNGTYSRKPWRDADEAYRALSRMSRIFLKRLRRWQSKRGHRVTRNEWIGVVEAHRSGWPHMNLMVFAPELAAELESERKALELVTSHREAVLLRGELLTMATASEDGLTMFGAQSTAERCRGDRDTLAGYFVKLAGLADQSAGEIAKLTQLPLNAPERFRRLRSGKGFLPPRHRDESVTGTLIRRGRGNDGTPHAMPLHNVKRPELVPHVAAVAVHEERLLVDELAARHWNEVARGVWPEAAHATPLVSTYLLPPDASLSYVAPVAWPSPVPGPSSGAGGADDTPGSSPQRVLGL